MPWDFWFILFVLGVLIPWRGRVRLKRLLAQPGIDTREKLALYGSTIAVQWILLGIVAWRAFARGLTSSQLGLAQHLTLVLILVGLVGAGLLGALQWFNLSRVSRLSGPVPELLRKIAERLLPRNTFEVAPYCALSLTAGVCEEFLYRGFAWAALDRAGIPTSAVVIITSVLFGLAHAYQGRSGMVGTALVGIVLAGCRLWTHSLVPGMAWHSAVDLAAGIAGPRYFFPANAEK
ncbi:MAG TPA: type II CAAX endopeptidase family protein [Candidatus Limnocylindrales bacterium]|nr:type II CAAX endopeptidase family protein [Candidatus Limnocylindrales bacterium]